MKSILFFSTLFGVFAGCSDETPKAVKSTQETYPQAPHVKVGDLAKVLPKDKDGNAVLWKVGDTKLVLGTAPTPGPDTSSAACLDLQNSCLMVADRSNAKLRNRGPRKSPVARPLALTHTTKSAG